MASIAIIIPYFGQWPAWISLFFASCRCNKSIDFHLFTDLELPNGVGTDVNIHIHPTSFADYCSMASERLNIVFHPNKPYKLCDLRPYYGYIHQKELKDYDFWGFGDIDLVWGNIRDFYTEELLQRYDVLSTHADRLSGHLTLIRNSRYYTELPFGISNWQELLSSPDNHALDEIAFTRKLYHAAPLMWKIHRHVFFRFRFRDEWLAYNHFCHIFNRLLKPRRLYLKEQYTTPWFTDTEAVDPEIINRWRWIYRDGHINDIYTGNELIYIHFLRLKQLWEDGFYTLGNKTDAAQIDLNGIRPIFDTTSL